MHRVTNLTDSSGLISARQTIVLDDFQKLVATIPDKTAVVSYLAHDAQRKELNYRDMGRLVDQLALKLLDLGIKPGDFVSYQLPNRWEFAVLHLATVRIGAISNAIMPIYGKREIRFMLERTKSKLCVALKWTKGSDNTELMSQLKDETDSLEHILLIDDDGGSLESMIADVPLTEEAKQYLDTLKPGPADIEAILFSSGTTGEPKGVLHSFDSTYRATSNAFERMEMSDDDVVLMSSPLGHATGFMYGVEMPIYCGCKAVYQEAWDPLQMLRIIERERVTWTMGSASFVRDACNAAETTQVDTSSLRCFVSGGAPIPPPLVGRMTQMLGGKLIPCWGMTEIGIAALSFLSDSEEKRSSSDGYPVDGVELRVVDEAGKQLPPNESGSLEVRASGQHVGYFQNEKLYKSSFDGNGWFNTGDLARMDAEGYIRIAGRSKDLVIRGGENIPIIEIENLLLDHPDIADAVIVGVPDERLGERCHAVIVLKQSGSTLSLDDLKTYLKNLDVTKQYWPEFLTLADDLPRTASGKIQRFKVREEIIARGTP